MGAPAWTLSFYNSTNIVVENVKEISKQFNSDGIDICNSRNVRVDGGYFRVNDDEICLKTAKPASNVVSGNITVQGVVIWNERDFGLGITYETRADMSHILFQNCDVIHDTGRAALTVYLSDSGTMSDIRFDNIRFDNGAWQLILGQITSDQWGHDTERGHVKGLMFSNIAVSGHQMPPSAILGADATHLIEDITFDHVTFNNAPETSLAKIRLHTNQFVSNVRCTAAPAVAAAALTP